MSLTAEQIEIRRSGIGASEAAAVLGLSPWQKPIDVYLSKLGLTDGPVETPAMRLGTRLEGVVIDLYAEETGQAVTRLGTMTQRHRDYSMVLATPDAEVSTSHLVEAKTTSHDDGWGEPGTDAIPEHYLVQVAVQMAVTGAPRCDVAVLNVLRRDFRIYTVRRDLELEAAVLPRLVDFWRNHVEKQEPPPLDGSAGWTDYLRRKFPRHGAAVVPADDAEIVALVRGTVMLKADAKSMGALLEHNENALRARIADNAGLEGWWGRATWKKTADTRRTDWEAVARELMVCSSSALAGSDWDDAVSKHTETKEGQRRLLVSPSKRLLDTAGTTPQIGEA